MPLRTIAPAEASRASNASISVGSAGAPAWRQAAPHAARISASVAPSSSGRAAWAAARPATTAAATVSSRRGSTSQPSGVGSVTGPICVARSSARSAPASSMASAAIAARSGAAARRARNATCRGAAARGGATSRTIPPPIVRRRPDSHSTNRSVTSRTSASSVRTRSSTSPSARRSRMRRRAVVSPAPVCTVNAPRSGIRSTPRTGRAIASKTGVGRNAPGTQTIEPRCSGARSTPARFAATRDT